MGILVKTCKKCSRRIDVVIWKTFHGMCARCYEEQAK